MAKALNRRPSAHVLQNLELIDVQLSEGFGNGLVKMQALKKLLVIPVYKDEVRGSMMRSHRYSPGPVRSFLVRSNGSMN